MLEGVTKFSADHHEGADGLSERERHRELLSWRRILFDLQLLGQDPVRYDGAGYGNMSCRVGAPSAPRGHRPFLVTGTQSGGKAPLGEDDLCVVEHYDIAGNAVRSRGPAWPSSESMTHGAIYDLSTTIRWVIHVHCPVLWNAARTLRLPATLPGVDYGTQEMAREMGRLFRETHLSDRKVLAMSAHEDGIIAFGKTAAEACSRLLDCYARALGLPAGS